MKKIVLGIMFLVISIQGFGEIILKIQEPIRFTHVNTSRIDSDEISGRGRIEILADESDIGKKLVFIFPEYGLMTNKKRWIKIKKYDMEDKHKSFEIVKKNDVVDFYAILDRKNLDKNEAAEIIEGEYISYVPVIVRQFSKKKATTTEDIPVNIPEI